MTNLNSYLNTSQNQAVNGTNAIVNDRWNTHDVRIMISYTDKKRKQNFPHIQENTVLQFPKTILIRRRFTLNIELEVEINDCPVFLEN